MIPVLLSVALAGDHLEIKWMRDSVEYATLTRQVYAEATEEVLERAKKQGKKPWAVVLDVDETALDNSPYQLERAAYGDSYADASWDAWCERRAAQTVPGVVDFVAAVRAAGGRVAWITNRNDTTRLATVDNLRAVGLYRDGDVACLKTTDDAYTKVARRAELRAGKGACAFDKPVTVLAYVGDTITDLPEKGEEDVTWSAEIGERYFVLPNPMYGSWQGKVTRPLP